MQNSRARRLGRVEAAILAELDRAGGLLNREAVVSAVFPHTASSKGAREDGKSGGVDNRRRANAEATMSRAIVSLERKGLVVREVNPTTRRVTVRSRDCATLPQWEEIARAEEDLGAHCMKQAAQWVSLARRLHRRAAAIRTVRSLEGTEAERHADLDAIRRLEQGSRSR